MPNHRRGYTSRGIGYQAPDKVIAQEYARRAKSEPCHFDAETSQLLIDELIISCEKIDARLHGAVSEKTHLHALVSWNYVRGWMSIRRSLKTSLTRRLIQLDNGVSLSRAGSRKHVKTRAHFDHLMRKYLPDHRGIGWYEDRGQTR